MQRRIGHELLQRACGRKSVEDEQPGTGDCHVSQSVARLMWPFLEPCRKGHVDEQDLGEVDNWDS